MRLPTLTLCAAGAVAVLLACSQQDATIDVDPKLGEACFEMRRTALPIGTQYEGIEGADAGSISIRIMDGTGVISVTCALKPDGTLSSAGD